MPAEVETMFYTREKPWHGLGVKVDEAPTAKEALKLAGLDWMVENRPIFDSQGNEIPGYRANTRDKDNRVLGIVSNRYRIVQNMEAFDFTDSLVGEGLRYETAGALFEGKQIWLLGRLPDRLIVGDKMESYICFTNTHDGLGGIKCCMTPIRVVCNNTLNLALSSAKRAWSTCHVGKIDAKLQEAKLTLQLADRYLKALEIAGDDLANQAMTEGEMRDVLDKLIPIDESMSDLTKERAQKKKDDIIICTLSPDLIKFANTKWAFVNGVADYIDHADPIRKTKIFDQSRWRCIMNGNVLLDKVMEAVS